MLQRVDSDQAPKFLKGHAAGITMATLDPDGSKVVTGSDDWSARLWDAKSGVLLSTMRGHVNSVDSVAFSSDSTLIASVGRDDTLRVWDPASGVQLFRFEVPPEPRRQRIFDFDGSQILYRAGASEVWLVDCEPCSNMATLQSLARARLKVEVR